MPSTHLHKQIRDALVAAMDNLVTTGARVYANRVYPLTDAELPALRIFIEEEEAEWQTSDIYSRVLYCTIEACAKVNSSLDDTLDQISLEVEVSMAAAGITVDGSAMFPEYVGMRVAFEEADQPVGVKRMRWRLNFFNDSSTPNVLL